MSQFFAFASNRRHFMTTSKAREELSDPVRQLNCGASQNRAWTVAVERDVHV